MCHFNRIFESIVTISGLLLIITVTSFVTPHCRPISWDDASINNTYVRDTAGVRWFVRFSFALVLLLYCAVQKARCRDLWPWIGGQLFTTALQGVMTQVLQLYAGRPRPDYLSRLRYHGYDKDSYIGSTVTPSSEASYWCELGRKHTDLRDGRLSFPSLEASLMFSLSVFVIFFLWEQLQPSAGGGSLTRMAAAVSPIIFAILSCVDQTRKNESGFDDVLAGAFVGTMCAVLCYNTVLPKLKDGACASPPRVGWLMRKQSRGHGVIV
uniref:Uncharacterized protein TCIL3000_10_13740 n=1 Tax=Trypanosoma congolense (strain IL3000) TaxID=1068625 RepID=G0UYX1_TRYCI|nr:unnamed protein product [Trypanosoma congolense IL3000]